MEQTLFNEDGIKKFLRRTVNIIFFDEIDSTSDEAKRRLSKKTSPFSLHKTVIVAAFQSGGRGRMCGRKFYSPRGSGVYLSFIYSRPILHPHLVTVYASLSVSRAIKSVYGVESQIKWVNDIYVGGKKVSGILTEGIANQDGIQSFVVGIGINVFVKNLPDEIKNVAGGIINENEETNLNEITACVIDNLVDLLEKDDESEVEEYKLRSNILGKKITVIPLQGSTEGIYTANAIDIDNEGRLVVETADGEERHLSGGEISIRGF